MHRFSAISDDYIARLIDAKRELLRGGTFKDPVIPASLWESWQRSHGHGVQSGDRKLVAPDYPQYLINDADRHLSAIVGQEIDAIWDSFGGENWVVYCTNADGLIIRTCHGTNPMSRAFALHVGRRIQECDIGTTAPGCALHEKRPVTLIGAEHYLDEFSHLFCCAVPLWGPWGEMVGVINITGSEEFKCRLVEKKLTTAAVKIENRLFIEAHSANNLFKIHYDADFIDTHLAGLVAINAFGDILSMTRTALEMLDFIDVFNTRWNIADLFMDNFVPDEGYCLRASLKNGIVFYSKACPLGATGALSDNATVRIDGSLRNLSEVHMLETLKRASGNISQAARILGVSRNTLYRALQKKTAKR
jgi:transcriptional regulator of acetoin/glycerol metabolism